MSISCLNIIMYVACIAGLAVLAFLVSQHLLQVYENTICSDNYKSEENLSAAISTEESLDCQQGFAYNSLLTLTVSLYPPTHTQRSASGSSVGPMPK